MSQYDALMSAGQVRLRPIVMTTLAMVFGMLPMAIGMGEGGEIAGADGPRGDRRGDHLDLADLGGGASSLHLPRQPGQTLRRASSKATTTSTSTCTKSNAKPRSPEKPGVKSDPGLGLLFGGVVVGSLAVVVALQLTGLGQLGILLQLGLAPGFFFRFFLLFQLTLTFFVREVCLCHLLPLLYPVQLPGHIMTQLRPMQVFQPRG
jgi:hypothetical protein